MAVKVGDKVWWLCEPGSESPEEVTKLELRRVEVRTVGEICLVSEFPRGRGVAVLNGSAVRRTLLYGSLRPARRALKYAKTRAVLEEIERS